MTSEDVLRELVADVEAVFGDDPPPYTKHDFDEMFDGWTDLSDTYHHAKEVLAAPSKAQEVHIYVRGGVVQGVQCPVKAIVHDYDVEGCDEGDSRLKTDDEGEQYLELEFVS